MSVYWLKVSEPGHPARVVAVDNRLEVGRDCEGLLLDDPTVSRRHLYLEPTAEGLVCVDMGSANGTFVDGTRVEGPMALRAGAVIALGETELEVREGRETQNVPGEQIEIDPHDRPSEAVRNLSSASKRTHVDKPPT